MKPTAMPPNARGAGRPKLTGQARAATKKPPMPAQAKAKLPGMKSGGAVKKYAKGGSIDGCAKKGKTKGKMR